MDRVTIEKKTVEEAILEALLILKVPRDEVKVDVIEEGSKGFLGIGSKEAKVVVTKKSALHLYERPVVEEKESFTDNLKDKFSDLKEDIKEKADSTMDKASEIYADVKEDISESFDEGKEKVSESFDEGKEKVSEIYDDASDYVEEKSKDIKEDVKDLTKKVKSYLHDDEIFETEDDAIEGTKDFLLKLMNKMGYEGEVKVLESDEEESFILDIVPNDYKSNSRFIGKKGDTLSAIGYLTGIYLSNRYKENLRVEVDCGDYIYQKKEDIKSFARSAAQKALKDGRFVFRPMTAYDRRIVHKTVNEIEGLSTYSEGEEPKRRVVIERDPQ